MATPDVPGSNPTNGDILKVGAWAEHDDGSLVFVMNTEGDRVVYEIFDLSTSPVVEYRHAMARADFDRAFNGQPKDVGKIHKDKFGNQIRREAWTWHDKTPFPVDRIFKAGSQAGMRYATADDLLSAAARVAKDLKIRGEAVKSDLRHMTDQEKDAVPSRDIWTRIQSAIDRLW